MARVVLILGGARSGKSARALALAPAPHLFIATAEALDAEMADRIRLHKDERGADWGLIEAPLDLPGAIADAAASGTTLVIDCLTLWLSNI
ncbi:MAG: bifunctional adenosylcobinamide kinase/adenosylcobinamide-phosphate guanylyltransferase, partial [Pseudomonadota bacterium]